MSVKQHQRSNSWVHAGAHLFLRKLIAWLCDEVLAVCDRRNQQLQLFSTAVVFDWMCYQSG